MRVLICRWYNDTGANTGEEDGSTDDEDNTLSLKPQVTRQHSMQCYCCCGWMVSISITLQRYVQLAYRLRKDDPVFGRGIFGHLRHLARLIHERIYVMHMKLSELEAENWTGIDPNADEARSG